MTRTPTQSGYMDEALREAETAARLGEVPVGAIIVQDNVIIARAHNMIVMTRDPTAHAEMIALRRAADHLGNERLHSCDLYVTLEPCAMCAGAISLARIRRLYYAAQDEKGGAVDHGARVFSHATCHHAPDVYGGLNAQKSATLLQQFFSKRR